MYEYFEDAIEPDNRDLRHKVLFPSKSTYKGRRWDGYDKNDREKTIDYSDGRIVVTHTDADGYVSGALFHDFFDGDVDVVTIDYGDIESTFEYIYESDADISELYVADLNLDKLYGVIINLANSVDNFVWLDHHEWDDEVIENLTELGVDITIDRDRAGAGLVYEYITERGYIATDEAKEIVEITEDHDLWRHELEDIQLGEHTVCISEAFSQLAFYSDTDKFIESILIYGDDFMDYEEELLRGDNGEGFIAEKEAEHQRKINYIIDNETEVETIYGYKVAFSHGRASPGQLIDRLDELHYVDILIHTKPSYPVKVSIRSTGNFNKCHELAERFGGGGHEQAAGFTTELIQEPLEFSEYVSNHGRTLHKEIKPTIEEFLKTA